MISRKFVTCAVCALIVPLLSAPAIAQTTASSSAYSASADLNVLFANAHVDPLLAVGGVAPAPYDTANSLLNAHAAGSVVVPLVLTVGATVDAGVLTNTAKSDYPGTPSAIASATIANLSAGMDAHTLFQDLFQLDLASTTIQSISTVDAANGLTATGQTLLQGFTLSGSLLGNALTVDTSLFANPAANTVLFDALGLRVVLNEQIFSGNGITDLGLQTNAFRATFNNFLLGPNLLNGDIIIGHSQAAINDYVPVVGAVPEPSTWAMMLAGFGLIGFAARGRRRNVALA